MIKIIKVIWADPHSIDDWKSLDEIDERIRQIISVGILIKETDDKVVLALNLDLVDEGVSCTMVIAKSCIIDIKEINCVKKEIISTQRIK